MSTSGWPNSISTRGSIIAVSKPRASSWSPSTRSARPQRIGWAGEGLEADRRRAPRDRPREWRADHRRSSIALDAITHQQATFTHRDLAMFVHRHSDGLDQFNAVMGAVRSAPDLVQLGKDGRGEERFTSREMIEGTAPASRCRTRWRSGNGIKVNDADREAALARAEAARSCLSRRAADAFAHVTDGRDLGIVVGYAGTGKSAMLGVAREAWEAPGYEVRGVALSGIAAENLESGSGIASRTIASLEHRWAQGRELLTIARCAGDRRGRHGRHAADGAGADRAAERRRQGGAGRRPEQLQAIEAGAAFRSIAERHRHVEITEVRRQREDWQRDATRDLATGRTGEALEAYERARHGPCRANPRARRAAIWSRAGTATGRRRRTRAASSSPTPMTRCGPSMRRPANGCGQPGSWARTSRHGRARRADFASGDRVMFLQNDRGLGVKNGTLGDHRTGRAPHP